MRARSDWFLSDWQGSGSNSGLVTYRSTHTRQVEKYFGQENISLLNIFQDRVLSPRPTSLLSPSPLSTPTKLPLTGSNTENISHFHH